MTAVAVDIGTNTVRLLVVDERGSELDRRVTVTRLGQGVDATGRLHPEAVARTLEVLAGYRNRIDALGADRVRAVATSASRDAANRDDFLDRAEAVLGVRPDLISGSEEAGLSFRGAIGGLPVPHPALVIDVGGGSTEFVAGDQTPEAAVSVDMGSVRLTERLLPDRPAPLDAVARARTAVMELFGRVLLPEVKTVIGVGGTFTSLAAIARDLPAYDRSRVHGSRHSLVRMGELVDWLATLTVEETAAIPSLDPARAPVLLGGAVVAEASVAAARHREVVVSEHDMLDAIVAGLLAD